MTLAALTLSVVLSSGLAPVQQPASGAYVPAPASQIPNYWDREIPCVRMREYADAYGRREFEPVKEEAAEAEEAARPEEVAEAEEAAEAEEEPAPTPVETRVFVREILSCGFERMALEDKTLRELSILRNTIFARYGWAGFRKTWLREHFKQQPWYKPNPKFSPALLSDVDRKNVERIAQLEMGLRYVDLEDRRDAILARAGKWWDDAPLIRPDFGEEAVPGCELNGPNEFQRDAIRASKDCKHHAKPAPNGAREPSFKQLSAEDRIELGLLSRAMGSFAVDDEQRSQMESSLDRVLSVKELRQLSLRDLRLLRNTLYARRGRPFKSELLQDHFGGMPWYKPDPTYTDARLTKTDLRNIKLITSVEREFGGALKDKDFEVQDPSQDTDPNLPSFPYYGA